MKKATTFFFVILIALSLSFAVWAAEKMMTSYTLDKNFGVIKPGKGISAPPPSPEQTSTPAPITEPTITQQFPPIVNNPSSPSITTNPATQSISMGSSVNDGSGAMWYGGTSASGVCNPCVNGSCTFGLGVRAYFEFKYDTPDTSAGSTAVGDGFTFTIMNASRNNISKRGGPANTSISLGELLGYGGTGNTSTLSSAPLAPAPLDGLGLRPPKMAIEFDTYHNPGAMTLSGCSGGRADTANNHIALLFWGLDPAASTMCASGSTAGASYPQAPFDDNIHGAGTAGSATVPRNSASGDGTGGYHERAKGASTFNWMEDGQTHRVRVEFIRTPSSSTYQVKTWVNCEINTSPFTACPASELINFQNIYNPYLNATYPPKIDRTVTLDTSLNSLLDTIFFGFTQGTGAATQQVQLSNFSVFFPQSSINPLSRSHTPASATGQTVSVATAAASCNWTAISNHPSWLTVTGGASGTGPGTVTYSVAANPGAERTGTITIGNQNFVVTQVGCSSSISPTSRTHTSAAASGQTVSLTINAACSWTAVSNNAWITVTGGASGTGNGTVTYSITANTGAGRTGSITIAGQTFTVTQATGPPACTLVANPVIVPYNSTSTLTWSITNGPANGAWSGTPGGTCASFSNSTGGSCATSARTTQGTNTFTLTVTNAFGSSTCSTSINVGCERYMVWNMQGVSRDFRVPNNDCRNNRANDTEITTTTLATRLGVGQTIRTFAQTGTCATSLGIELWYVDALNADAGGDNDCQVNFTGHRTATDR